MYQNNKNGESSDFAEVLNNLKKSLKSMERSKSTKSKKANNSKVNKRLLTVKERNTKNCENVTKNKKKKKSKRCVVEPCLVKSSEMISIDNMNEVSFNEEDGEIVHDLLHLNNPIDESIKLFEWVIYPLNKEEFFDNNWEKNPFHIKRNKSKYYQSLMSTPMLDQILRNNYILFTKNLDITSYTNNKRETHNPEGRALPSIVWDYYSNGCSVRLLNPQTFIPKLHTLNATLQEFFGCFVGSNSYLTPPNSQGFAPHYDDIEAFILQIEGKKRWRLYKPKTDSEILPRYSSQNLSSKDLGEPILDTIVKAGDILYFPRGTIHEGDTFGFDEHSLHITLSVYQRNSWGDYLEKLLPVALQNAIRNDVRFRKGLPMNYLRHIGSTYNDNLNCPTRKKFASQINSLLTTLLSKYVDMDKAADEMAANHMHDFLPPVLDDDERLCSIYEGGERMIKNGAVVNRVEIEPNTFIKLSRSHCARLVEESEQYRLYYSTDNSKEYHEYEPQFLEVDSEYVPAVKELLKRYPLYIKVEDLPINDLDKKMQLAQDLWEKAIVISEQPLLSVDD